MPYFASTLVPGGIFPTAGFTTDTRDAVIGGCGQRTGGSVRPNLTLPYTQQWSAAAEYSFGSNQSVTATYVGSAGRRLIQTVAIPQANGTFLFPFLVVNDRDLGL